jgi:NAD-reducing hydrogenase large subunit
VHQVRLHIVEFRGFEKFIQGRPYWEVPVMVQRLCGICPVSHHLAASQGARHHRRREAADAHRREAAPPDALRPDPAVARAALLPPRLARPAVRLRRRGGEAQHRRRRRRAPEVAKKGVLLRKYGQEVIRHTAGKRVHGTGSVPGGVNKNLTRAERAELLGEIDTR